jgi:hypothetical protein
MAEEINPVAGLLTDLGGSLESSALSAITDPLVGWVSSFLGLGSSGGDDTAALQTITNQLTQLANAITVAEDDLLSAIKAAAVTESMQASQNQIQSAVDLAKNYVPAAVVPDGTYGSSTQFLTLVNATLLGALADGGTPGAVGYLPTFLEKNLRYYSDNSPYYTQCIAAFFAFHEKLQFILTEMAAEAAHAGQPAVMSAAALPPGGIHGYPPPNYSEARNAYETCATNLGQQESYRPFPTTGVGRSVLSSIIGSQPIVYDRNSPGIAWASINLASPATVPSSYVNYRTVPAIFDIMNAPGNWMLRLPTWDELAALYAATVDPTTWNGSGYQSMVQLGFNVGLELASTDQVGYPFMTSDALKSSNWAFVNPFLVDNDYVFGAHGYSCTWFYDMLKGVGIEVRIYCPVSQSSISVVDGQRAPNDGMFADMRNATAVSFQSSLGVATGLSVAAYMDALVIYQPLASDPPLEEPSQLQINPVGPQSAQTTQLTAVATFQRLYPNSTTPEPVTMNISQVGWSLDDADTIATIDQTGLVTWKQAGSVNVQAVRGTLASPTMQVVSTYAPQAPTPVVVNIAPLHMKLNATIPPQGVTLPFTGQVLWSDGSTSSFSDDGTHSTSATGQALPSFTYAFAVTNVKDPAKPQVTLDNNAMATFTVPQGNLDPFEITLTINGNPQLAASASIDFQ